MFDVIVIGAGHAGCEAAHAAARMGRRVLLLTQDPARVAAQSCNPAVGGVGKGHIVREVIALGGVMGEATDASGIHFKTLNTRKGPAVRATRVQTDSARYTMEMMRIVTDAPGVTLGSGEACAIVTEGEGARRAARGVRLADGTELGAAAVVVATGTFLNGVIHVGLRSSPAGRIGEPPSAALGGALAALGLRLGRLKTGTCPRVDADSVDFSRTEVEPPDDPPPLFTDRFARPPLGQVDCHVTWTGEATHRVILGSLDRSPLYAGVITGAGPRYCPSIEDKVVRFRERDRHRVFLEPEGLGSRRLYLSGLSTSLPPDAQEAMVRTLPGLEEARVLRWGYAVEYDFCDPTQAAPTLEVKGVRGLFLAGQINGTSGYEEAAGQGVVAGINAALRAGGEEGVVIGRDEAYIGVMIDDLVTRGTAEPYRMMTSRAERRLLLREDNAFERLGPLAERLGLLPGDDLRRGKRREADCARLVGRFKALRPAAPPEEALPAVAREEGIGDDPRTLFKAAVELRYEGYLAREKRVAARLRAADGVAIPPGFAYRGIPGISNEVAGKLEAVRPLTLGQASRVPGITPAAVSLLWVLLRRGQ